MVELCHWEMCNKSNGVNRTPLSSTIYHLDKQIKMVLKSICNNMVCYYDVIDIDISVLMKQQLLFKNNNIDAISNDFQNNFYVLG